MKKIITTALATLVAVYGYSQNTYPFPENGDVGIGTTTPLSKLEIKEGNLLVRNLNNTDNNSMIMVAHSIKESNYTTFGTSIRSLTQSAGYNRYGMQFFTQDSYLTGQTEKLRISGNGNVGIGTTTPNQKLDIYGGIGFANQNSLDKMLYSPADGVLEWMTHNAAGEHGFAISHQGNKAIYLNTSGNSYINGGNLGIGTSTPAARVEMVVGDNDGGSGVHGVRIVSEASGLPYQLNLGTSPTGGYNYISSGQAGIGLKNLAILANNIGIGTTDPKGYKLAVAGNMIAESVKVALQNTWPDYVFKPGNKLLSLPEVEKFVQQNNHLPEIPSEAEVKKEGINLGQMDTMLLKKIEELTLYMIEQNKESAELHKILEAQNKLVQQQNERIAKLENLNK